MLVRVRGGNKIKPDPQADPSGGFNWKFRVFQALAGKNSTLQIGKLIEVGFDPKELKRSFLSCAMSRCFPFPPPGYERKHRPEDLDLLKEVSLVKQITLSSYTKLVYISDSGKILVLHMMISTYSFIGKFSDMHVRHVTYWQSILTSSSQKQLTRDFEEKEDDDEGYKSFDGEEDDGVIDSFQVEDDEFYAFTMIGIQPQRVQVDGLGKFTTCFASYKIGDGKQKTNSLLLAIAKRKEKKHKKEKKDKDRKKDKEKKEKDGSDEKHKDKKDRKEKHKDKKEKHRDKKKDKEDRGKDKEKSSISEESTVAGNEKISEGKLLHPKGHIKDKSSFPNEGKCSALLQGQNGGKPSQSSLPSQENEESKFVQELDRRIRDENSRGGQLPERVAVEDKSDQEMATRSAVRNSSGVLAEEKVDKNKKVDRKMDFQGGDNQNKRVDKKMDPQGLKNELSGNTMVQNLTPIAKSKVEGIPRPGQAKDRSKESHGKDKHKEKKDDKVKLKTENKKSEQDKLKDDGRNDLGGFAGNKSTDMLKNAISNVVNEGNIRKRKDMGTNGFLHVYREWKETRTFRIPTKPSHNEHAVTPNSVRVETKNQLMNGIFEAQKPSPSKPNPSAATMVSDQIAEASKIPRHNLKKAVTVSKMEEDPMAEASRRPPHPDSKYLAEVLTVPKMADWSENDEQDWLFSEKGPSRPKLESFGVNDNLRVWSEAIHIDSADVCALPYVIPY
ncbi:hypothetical protein DH2020_005081 [Rehmannia glutinosa]|uniref:Uncharacterized protein n=1 Tax=Rehmannia glutinosa TaxID=99300 RepID=A0ABR0XRL4_REHGL